MSWPGSIADTIRRPALVPACVEHNHPHHDARRRAFMFYVVVCMKISSVATSTACLFYQDIKNSFTLFNEALGGLPSGHRATKEWRCAAIMALSTS